MNQTRFRRTQGGVSKAAACREIVRQMEGAEKRDVIDAIQAQLGFNRAMSRHYYYCAVRAVAEDKYKNETVKLDEVQNVETQS